MFSQNWFSGLGIYKPSKLVKVYKWPDIIRTIDCKIAIEQKQTSTKNDVIEIFSSHTIVPNLYFLHPQTDLISIKYQTQYVFPACYYLITFVHS